MMVTCGGSDTGSNEGARKPRNLGPKAHSWPGVERCGAKTGPRLDRLDDVEQRDRGQIPREHPAQPAPRDTVCVARPRTLRSDRPALRGSGRPVADNPPVGVDIRRDRPRG